MKPCRECKDFDKEEGYCNADIWGRDYPMTCLMKMIIAELRWGNMPEMDEGDEWKI